MNNAPVSFKDIDDADVVDAIIKAYEFTKSLQSLNDIQYGVITCVMGITRNDFGYVPKDED